MCIITGPTLSVNHTTIVHHRYKVDGKHKQLVLYSNKVLLADNKPVQMILPVPAKADSKIKLFDSSKNQAADDMLEECRAAFSVVQTKGLYRGAARPSSETLPVFQVGSYKVSIAETFEELKALDPEVFNSCDDDFLELMSDYHIGHQFVCAKLESSAQFHPLVYEYDPIFPDHAFVPTKHYHPELDTEGKLKPVDILSGDYDHEIYFFGSCASLRVDFNLGALHESANDDLKVNYEYAAFGNTAYCELIEKLTNRSLGSVTANDNFLYKVTVVGKGSNTDIRITSRDDVCAECYTFETEGSTCMECTKPDGGVVFVCHHCLRDTSGCSSACLKHNHALLARNRKYDTHKVRNAFCMLDRSQLRHEDYISDGSDSDSESAEPEDPEDGDEEDPIDTPMDTSSSSSSSSSASASDAPSTPSTSGTTASMPTRERNTRTRKSCDSSSSSSDDEDSHQDKKARVTGINLDEEFDKVQNASNEEFAKAVTALDNTLNKLIQDKKDACSTQQE